MGKNKAVDLVGMTFGKWKVLERAKDRYDKRGDVIKFWVCQCSCEKHTIREVRGNQLIAGASKSCGCVGTKRIVEHNRTVKKKYNDYVILNNYVIFYTKKNEPFLVDLEDFGKVKKYCWSKNKDGYLMAHMGKNGVYLHRYIMGFPEGKRVDHKGGELTRFDNRKRNLRVATPSQNNMNKKLQSNNTSGYAGVGWHKDISRWVASITVNGEYKHIGTYINKDDAIKARKEAEDKYFGEWSYANSQMHNREE